MKGSARRSDPTKVNLQVSCDFAEKGRFPGRVGSHLRGDRMLHRGQRGDLTLPSQHAEVSTGGSARRSDPTLWPCLGIPSAKAAQEGCCMNWVNADWTAFTTGSPFALKMAMQTRKPTT